MTYKNTRKALLASAVSTALIATVNVAGAADLDTLSDDDLLERIERLERIIGPGNDNAVRSGNSRVRIELNGQVNQQVRYANDGEDQGVQFTDNDSSSSRFRILSRAKLTDDITAGTAFEFDIETNTSSQVDLFDSDEGEAVGDGPADSFNFDVRKAEVFFTSKTYGKISLGQGSTATDGTSEQNLSGTAFIQDHDSDDGALDFRFADGSVGPDIGDAFTVIDGAGRDNRIRYDAPTVYGITLSASAETRGRYDVAARARYSDVAGFDVVAGVGYVNTQASADTVTSSDPDRLQTLNGSLSVLHRGTGLNIYGAAGTILSPEESADAAAAGFGGDFNDGRFFYIQGGWKTDIISDLGDTAFAVGYNGSTANSFSSAVADSFVLDTTSATPATVLVPGSAESATEIDSFFVTALVAQNIDALSAEVFARYTYYDAEIDEFSAPGVLTSSDDLQGIHVVAVGSRIKF